MCFSIFTELCGHLILEHFDLPERNSASISSHAPPPSTLSPPALAKDRLFSVSSDLLILGILFTYLIILLLFNYSCLHFPTTLSQTHLPPLLPLAFVHVSAIVVPENPSTHCPLLPPLWLLLDCS